MKINQIRNATLVVDYADKKFLMEAINYWTLSREELKSFADEKRILQTF